MAAPEKDAAGGGGFDDELTQPIMSADKDPSAMRDEEDPDEPNAGEKMGLSEKFELEHFVPKEVCASDLQPVPLDPMYRSECNSQREPRYETHSERYIIVESTVFQSLALEINTVRAYKRLPFYCIFLMLFTITTVITAITDINNNPLFYLNQGVKELMIVDNQHDGESPSLDNVGTIPEMWDWMNVTLEKVLQTRPYDICKYSFEVEPGVSMQNPVHTQKYPGPWFVVSQRACCAACLSDEECQFWAYDQRTPG